MSKVAIVGIGDLLRGDQGVGSYVIEALAQEKWPSHIELVDLGSEIYNLELYLYQREYVILVQALSRGYPGGRVYQLTHDELCRMYRGTSGACTMSVFQRLRLAEALGIMPPEITLIGIEPRMTCCRLGLSKEMRFAIRKAIRMIKKNLAQRGLLPSAPVVSLLRYKLDLLQITI